MIEERRSRLLPATSLYYYRRPLSARELVPAVGVAVATGLVAFYLAKLLLQRTPLEPGRGRADATRRPPPRTARR